MTEGLEMLLEAGADINASMGTHPHPLITATLSNSRQTVEWLLSHGAKADVTCGNYPFAIQGAIIRSADGFDSLIQSLISAGGDINASEGHIGVDENLGYEDDMPRKWHTHLVLAIQKNNPGIVDLLLLKGANVNDLSGLSYSTTALEAAASQADLGLVFRLLRAGAETDVVTQEHCWQPYEQVVGKILLERCSLLIQYAIMAFANILAV
ncbi:uncharacterized protein A1O9_07776 [Exophiala aquamarina CBS 119918]|uniref:Uncharacterized protein n=1 Tax=Exophiala aquamarina CBS 119918 TaxID=1182545 RepID=A0A072PL11_9EURO|nr:uncharacterized protein A1O9_07776 [Exophiala aquamarina CBS 119918]KEF56195.1 hypothetical protein A1O9_07776 [Exophiala aquamarina CBS 119918]